jgi:hypothetical protein
MNETAVSVTTTTVAPPPVLPAPFADLERFTAKWAVPDANERYERRLASEMEELQEFYDAAVARGEEVMAYLEQCPYEDLNEADTNLMWLYCSLSAVSFAIDVFRQPTVPETGGASMPWTVVPYP